MGERSSHAPGTFSFVDLGTSDAEAAKRFYAGLFGWEAEDMPIPGDGTYSMMRVDGKTVCALYQREGVPPAWLSYVTVEDADATAARAKELGGSAMQEAFDVLDAGRMAVLQDPQGAIFAAWQPKQSIGAELVNDPGALSLTQLNSPDPEAAASFYSELFGWRIDKAVEQPPYWGIYNGDRLSAGMMPLPPGSEAPPHWLAYFTTADLDGSIAKLGDGGGTVLVPPMDVPGGGRIVVAQDPQGAVFALFEGRVDD